MHRAIEEARNAGHKDDDILRFMSSKDPKIEKASIEALGSGYTSTQVLDFISATTKEGKLPGDIPKGNIIPQEKRGFGSGFHRGFQRGVIGLVGGAEEQLPRDEGFLRALRSSWR